MRELHIVTNLKYKDEENYLNPLEELPGHHEIINNIMYLSK